MTTTDPGVARALAQVRRNAERLLASVADAEAALAGDPGTLTAAMTEAARTVPLSTPLTGEPLRCADGFDNGGWVRDPGGDHPLLWVQILSVAVCWCGHFLDDGDDQDEQPHVEVRLRNGVVLHLRKYDQLPYRTDAEFHADCDREALAEIRDLQAQRAMDFGHDHPGAA